MANLIRSYLAIAASFYFKQNTVLPGSVHNNQIPRNNYVPVQSQKKRIDTRYSMNRREYQGQMDVYSSYNKL